MDDYYTALQKVTQVLKQQGKFDLYFDQQMKFYELYSNEKRKNFEKVRIK